MDKERRAALQIAVEAARQAYFDSRARVVEQSPDAMAALDDAILRYEHAIELATVPRPRPASEAGALPPNEPRGEP